MKCTKHAVPTPRCHECWPALQEALRIISMKTGIFIRVRPAINEVGTEHTKTEKRPLDLKIRTRQRSVRNTITLTTPPPRPKS